MVFVQGLSTDRRKLLNDKFGSTHTQEDLLKIVRATIAELDRIERLRSELGLKPEGGKSLFADEEIFLTPQEKDKDRRDGIFELGGTIADLKSNKKDTPTTPITFGVTAQVDEKIAKDAVDRPEIGKGKETVRARPQLTVGYEAEKNEAAILAHIIRHELGHALVRRNVPDEFETYYEEGGGKEGFEKEFSTRHAAAPRNRRMTEAWAEAIAWFLSKDYPRGGIGANPGTRPRLPLEVEAAIMKELRRTN